MGNRSSRSLPLPFHSKSDERPPQGSNPPHSNASVVLPPEILDKILEHIPTHNSWGSQTLIACASVATWWTGPSQRRLFSSVKLHDDNRERWVNGVVLSGSRVCLLEHVHSLWHSYGLGYRMRDLAQDCGGYFSTLHNLHSLTLHNLTVEHINEDRFHTCFSAFRETLTCLFLNNFVTSFGAFVTIVDYFPNIATLRLRALDLEPDERPVPSLSRPLRGKVHVHYVNHFQADFSEFCKWFAKLDLEYEELVIESPGSTFGETEFLESALQISANTVKFLKLTTELRCEKSLSALIRTASLPNPSHLSQGRSNDP